MGQNRRVHETLARKGADQLVSDEQGRNGTKPGGRCATDKGCTIGEDATAVQGSDALEIVVCAVGIGEKGGTYYRRDEEFRKHRSILVCRASDCFVAPTISA